MKQRMWLIQVAAGRVGGSKPVEHYILTTGVLASTISEIVARNDAVGEIRIDVSSLREGAKLGLLEKDWVEAHRCKPLRAARRRPQK